MNDTAWGKAQAWEWHYEQLEEEKIKSIIMRYLTNKAKNKVHFFFHFIKSDSLPLWVLLFGRFLRGMIRNGQKWEEGNKEERVRKRRRERRRVRKDRRERKNKSLTNRNIMFMLTGIALLPFMIGAWLRQFYHYSLKASIVLRRHWTAKVNYILLCLFVFLCDLHI